MRYGLDPDEWPWHGHLLGVIKNLIQLEERILSAYEVDPAVGIPPGGKVLAPRSIPGVAVAVVVVDMDHRSVLLASHVEVLDLRLNHLTEECSVVDRKCKVCVDGIADAHLLVLLEDDPKPRPVIGIAVPDGIVVDE